MKRIPLDSGVLAGQGGGGSRIVTVPNPAPGVGSTSGDKTLSTEVPIESVSTNTGNLAPKSGDLLPK
jgi:hypothetical protein